MDPFQDGIDALKAGNNTEAEKFLRAATGLNPQNHKAWNALGIVFNKMGDYENASACFDTALGIDAHNPVYTKNRDKNRAKLERTEELMRLPDDDPGSRSRPRATPPPASSILWTGVKLVGGFIVVVFLLLVVSAFIYGMVSGGSHDRTASQAIAQPVGQQVQQVTVVQTVATAEPPEKTITLGEKNAAKKAKQYLQYSAFSRNGLIKQLEFEGFSHDESVYGTDQTGADWNEQAGKKAKQYLDISAFSRADLIKQLEFEGFTSQQSDYGVQTVGY